MNLEIFRKKLCSFCFKNTYNGTEKIQFHKQSIEIVFCEKCNKMSEEEKAVVVLARIINMNKDLKIEDILKDLSLGCNTNE